MGNRFFLLILMMVLMLGLWSCSSSAPPPVQVEYSILDWQDSSVLISSDPAGAVVDVGTITNTIGLDPIYSVVTRNLVYDVVDQETVRVVAVMYAPQNLDEYKGVVVNYHGSWRGITEDPQYDGVTRQHATGTTANLVIYPHHEEPYFKQYASQGYVVLYPLYIGLDPEQPIAGVNSKQHYQRMNVPESTQAESLALLKAFVDFSVENNKTVSGKKLFLMGHSQGGARAAEFHLQYQQETERQFNLIASYGHAGGYKRGSSNGAHSGQFSASSPPTQSEKESYVAEVTGGASTWYGYFNYYGGSSTYTDSTGSVVDATVGNVFKAEYLSDDPTDHAAYLLTIHNQAIDYANAGTISDSLFYIKPEAFSAEQARRFSFPSNTKTVSQLLFAKSPINVTDGNFFPIRVGYAATGDAYGEQQKSIEFATKFSQAESVNFDNESACNSYAQHADGHYRALLCGLHVSLAYFESI